MPVFILSLECSFQARARPCRNHGLMTSINLGAVHNCRVHLPDNQPLASYQSDNNQTCRSLSPETSGISRPRSHYVNFFFTPDLAFCDRLNENAEPVQHYVIRAAIDQSASRLATPEHASGSTLFPDRVQIKSNSHLRNRLGSSEKRTRQKKNNHGCQNAADRSITLSDELQKVIEAHMILVQVLFRETALDGK